MLKVWLVLLLLGFLILNFYFRHRFFAARKSGPPVGVPLEEAAEYKERSMETLWWAAVPPILTLLAVGVFSLLQDNLRPAIQTKGYLMWIGAFLVIGNVVSAGLALNPRNPGIILLTLIEDALQQHPKADREYFRVQLSVFVASVLAFVLLLLVKGAT